MRKRYFRMKDPKCRPEEIEWIEMTGREFYCFVHSPEGQNRHFIDMDDVVLEGTSTEARKQRAEKDHRDYLKEQEAGVSILSIYSLEDKHGCSGEEVAVDETQNVEAEAIRRIELKALAIALSKLGRDNYHLIHSMYLAENKKTERELAQEKGLSQVAIHKQKKKALRTLKFLVIKIQKSSQ